MTGLPWRGLSLLSELRRYDGRLTALSCPGCGSRAHHPVWRRDRYFLRIDLAICRDCGLCHVARGLTGADATRFYRDLYPRLMRQPPPQADLGLARLAAGYRLNLLRDALGSIDQVIEIGAGHGFFLAACREAGARSFHGIEPGAPQRGHAIEELGLAGHVEDADVESWTPAFQPRVIALFHVLEHLDRPGAVLTRLRGWLPQDGWLVIEVPDLSADWSALGLMQIHISHRSYFTPATLLALLARHGFAAPIVQREPNGVFPGNLRVFARLGEAVPPPPETAAAMTTHIVTKIHPWSLSTGYPRAAARLLMLALREH